MEISSACQNEPVLRKPNRIHGETTYKTLNADEWSQIWKEDKIFFHRNHVSSFLIDHGDKLCTGQTNVKVFVPLCGKSLDLKWLADKGYTVVGVEFVLQALEDFFQEHNIAYEKIVLENNRITLYKSNDGRIRLYCCSIFDFSRDVEGTFDAIVDRGSLTAIEIPEREKYVKLMKSLMSPGCRCLQETFDYDPAEMVGPPHSISDKELAELYGAEYSIEKLEYTDVRTNDTFLGLTEAFRRVCLIKFNPLELPVV